MDPARLDRRADREDWAENAVQLLAAAEAGLPVAAVAPGRRPGPQDAFRPEAFGSASPEEKRFLNGAETSSPGPHALKIGFGGRGDGDPVWPDADSAAAVARYARNPGFSAVAGRFARTAHVPGEGNAGDVVSSDDPKSLRSVVRQALRTSRRDPAELLVKIVSSAKYAPLEGFTLSKDASDLEIDGALLSALGYGLVHLEGSRDAVLVQERVDMRHEYRLVVVDGSPVAGAGCVEAFCPLDRTSDSGRFESRMEGARGDGDVEPRDEVLARYLSDAPDIVARLRKEDPGLKDFVLDLATGANGRTLVVEINPPWNFGLYAMDFALVLAAAVEASKARTRNPRQSGGDAR